MSVWLWICVCAGTWPRARYGLPSTSGTTASVAVLRGRILYTAHLGDSGIVLGRKRQPVADDGTPSDRDSMPSSDPSGSSAEGGNDDDNDEDGIEAVQLTIDHKPDCDVEQKAIESRGGSVRRGTRGVSRVVWKRKRPVNGRTVLNMAHSELITEEIPFLGVARSLGDLWSYNPDIGDYIVSCVPDVSHRTLTINEDHFIVLASDGLWNVLTPKQVVKSVAQNTGYVGVSTALERNSASQPQARGEVDDICHGLIQQALQHWRDRRQRADNISVIVAFFNQPSSSTSTSQSSQSSRTPTPVISNEQPSVPARDATEGEAESHEPTPPSAEAAVEAPRSPAAIAAAAVIAEPGDVSSSEESSSSSSDATSPPLLRRTTRVQARSQLGALDTPSSEEATTPVRVTRAATRRTPRASPANESPVSARGTKRRSTPSSSEGPGKRVSRSSVRDQSDKTPLQEDVVSSSSSGEDIS